jgi:hypothetical protein
VLSEELLRLPQTINEPVDRLEAAPATLAEAQARTEARLETLTARVDALTEAQARTEAELRRLAEIVAELAQGQSRLERDLARLRGSDLERRYRENTRRFFAPVVRHPRPASDDGIYRLLDDALARGALTDEEITDLASIGRPRSLCTWWPSFPGRSARTMYDALLSAPGCSPGPVFLPVRSSAATS